MPTQNLRVRPSLEISVFADVIKVRIEVRSSWTRVGLKSSDSDLMTDRKRHNGKRARDDRGRDWREAPTSQETPGRAGAARGRKKPPTGIAALPTLSGFQDWERIHFCCLKPPSLWHYEQQPQGTSQGPEDAQGHRGDKGAPRHGWDRAQCRRSHLPHG